MDESSDSGRTEVDGGPVHANVSIEVDVPSLQRRFLDLDRRYRAMMDMVIPLGTTLFYEQDYSRLLERILEDTQQICRADGGTLYLRTDDDHLEFAIVRNTSMNIAMGGLSNVKPPFHPLPLYHPDTGVPNHDHLAAHSALTGETFNIPDVYGFDRFDFSGTRNFDATTGYRSKSFVTVPLKARNDRVIGVLQMINAIDESGEVVGFDEPTERLIEALAGLAGAALEMHQREAKLQRKIKKLTVEIDHGKRNAEVSQIAESDYFKQLQVKANEMRRRAGRTDTDKTEST